MLPGRFFMGKEKVGKFIKLKVCKVYKVRKLESRKEEGMGY